MSWLKSTMKKVGGAAKSAISSPKAAVGAALGGGDILKTATQQTGDILKSGFGSAKSEVENKLFGAPQDAGKKVAANTKAQAAEQDTIRAQMEDQFGSYQGGVGEARKRYRGAEDEADKSYDQLVQENAGQAGGIEAGLAAKADKLEGEAESQATDASKVYSEKVRPQMQSNMENAMSLKDYMDPNNQVQTAYRGMYDQLGEQTRKQGMADYGVLAALGGQAAARGMQGRAMTGSQMMGAQQAGLGQAGLAYQRAQQRMQALQDQGIATGIAQSDKAYQAGQQARSDFTNEEARQLEQGRAARGERQGYAREAGDYRMRGVERSADINRGKYERDTSKRGARYGEDVGDLSMANQFRQGMLGMKRGDVSAKYGGMNESIMAGMNEEQARAGAFRGILTAGMGTGAQLAGQYLGSKGGAAPKGQAAPQAAAPAGEGAQYGGVMSDPNNRYNPQNYPYMQGGRQSYYS